MNEKLLKHLENNGSEFKITIINGSVVISDNKTHLIVYLKTKDNEFFYNAKDYED